MKQAHKRLSLPVCAVVLISAFLLAFSTKSEKPDSNFDGVQIGVITYSWRSLPSSPRDIINYCIQSGISSVELMGNVVEEYAGIPASSKKPKNWKDLDDEDKKVYEENADAVREWRLSGAADEKYREIRTMFDEAGIMIHTVKFAPANWSDEEIDYAFESAKIMGARGVTNEIGHKACRRLGPFAEKHGMYAVYHNHAQPGEPGFDFEEFLAYSPGNMLNLDVGHYFGATGKHPNEIIKKLHDRIYSIHLKDKTGKDADPANTNRSWGEGDTPLGEVLTLVRDNKWDIYCDIELEYEVPESSDAVSETAKCVEYCRNILME